MSNNKQQRFEKVATARTEKVVDALRLIGNCSNKNNYSYSRQEVEEMFSKIRLALDNAEKQFNYTSNAEKKADKRKAFFETEYTWLNGFMRNVRRYPDKKAVVYPFRHIEYSYSELNRNVNLVSNALISKKIEKGDVILLQLRNSIEFLTTYIAAHKTGTVACPINYKLAAFELKETIEATKPFIFIFEKENILTVKKALLHSSFKPHFVLICNTDENENKNETCKFQTFYDFYKDEKTDEPEMDYSLNMYDETTRLFTSGSSGKPQAVKISSINNILSAHDVIMHLPLNCTDIVMSITPWFYRGGLASIISTLYSGGTVIALRKCDVKKILGYVNKYKITYLISVPPVIERLARMQEQCCEDISSLNGIITMGGILDKAKCIYYQKTLTPNIFNGYGTTETFWNTFLRPYDLPNKAGSAGISCVDDEVRIVKMYDNKKAEPYEFVATDNTEEGEIIIKSPAKSSYEYCLENHDNYYKGYLYTGDKGCWDEEHYITVTGCRNYSINSFGSKINPKQVEKTINTMDKISCCAVTQVPDKLRGQMVVAYIVKENEDISVSEIDDFCKKSDYLASYKRPRYYRFIATIPLNSKGETDRERLAKMAEDDRENGLLIRV